MKDGFGFSKASAFTHNAHMFECIVATSRRSAWPGNSSLCSALSSDSDPMRMRSLIGFLLAALLVVGPRVSDRFFAQGAVAVTSAPWVEADFPFFSSVVDARKAGPGFPANNLTPRGLVLKVGPDTWAAFDVDLLRVSAIWRGKGVTPVALAPGSYHKPDRKTPGGQSPLPEPDGQVWLANGIYPGWQAGDRVSLEDPREPAPSPEEVGRGPLAEEAGRFKSLEQSGSGIVLAYTAAGVINVREHMDVTEANGSWTFYASFMSNPLRLTCGSCSEQRAPR